jgi:cellulose synthase/poly-beta-1,6-N-acetylglucosamine synthase-like glycosyltransferase
MIAFSIALIVFICSLLPASLIVANLRAYRPAPRLVETNPSPGVSLLIPARNEERTIEQALRCAMLSQGITLEIIVLDDDSQDGTAGIVQKLAGEDPRIRLESAPPLPEGWCGKQHACWILARKATHDLLVFVDADVRLAPDALARTAAFMQSSNADLASGFPRQIARSLGEKLVIPLIHFVLLGYLPLAMARKDPNPQFAAGCGQLFMAKRSAYFATGGHSAIRASLHDGITLPRAFRQAGFSTDLFDATDIAACRMYRGFGEVFRGFAKNATEGMATSVALPIWTFLLLARLLPWLVAPCLWLHRIDLLPRLILPGGPFSVVVRGIWYSSLLISLVTTAILTERFRQGWLSWFLHPIGVVLLVVIQWYALIRQIAGRPSQWKSRSYPAKIS